jgi:hypothetical protein
MDAVNATSHLSFNEHGAQFPSHKEQEEIAEGFKLKTKLDLTKFA